VAVRQLLDVERMPDVAWEFRLQAPEAPAAAPARLTREGLRRLEQELDLIETRAMPDAVQRIRANREMSADPLEAGEQAQAMEDLAQLIEKEAVLRTMIGAGEVVDVGAPHGVAQLGSEVTLREDHHLETFTIVGSAEADALSGRLSEQSPLGRSLIGHRIGDRVEWDSPGGHNRAKIVKLA
jgi:transcription elongation factor GreA